MNIADSADEQIVDILAATPVTSLDLGRYVSVAPNTSVGDTVAAINAKVSEVMDAAPYALGVRSTLAEAIETFSAHEDSHVALLGETERPVGVASFRDIAAYLEMSLEAAR